MPTSSLSREMVRFSNVDTYWSDLLTLTQCHKATLKRQLLKNMRKKRMQQEYFMSGRSQSLEKELLLVNIYLSPSHVSKSGKKSFLVQGSFLNME